jgi:hypothetical protein
MTGQAISHGESSTRRRQREPKQKVPVFDGQSLPFEQWCLKYDLITKRCEWTEEDKAESLALYLEGPALQQHLELPEEVKVSWRETKKMMSTFFPQVPKTTATYRMEFRQITQGRDEAVHELASQLEARAARAFPHTSKEGLEAEKMEQFISALWNNKIRETLVGRKISSFAELLEEAVRLEGYYKDRSKLRGQAGRGSHPHYIQVLKGQDQTSDDSEPESAGARRKKQKPRRRKNGAASNRTAAEPSVASQLSALHESVAQLQHEVARPRVDAKQRTRVNTQTQEIPPAYAGQDPRTVQCFHCKEFGHFRFDCPLRKRSSAETPVKRIHAFAAEEPVKTLEDRFRSLHNFLYVIGATRTYGEVAGGRPRILQDMDSLLQYGTMPEEDAPIKACFVPTCLYGLWVPSIVDTGATLSVMSKSLADKLEAAGKLTKEPSTVRAALFGNRGDAVQFREAAMVQVMVAGTCINVKMQILPDLPFECLLGDDFVSATGAIIDYQNRMFSINGIAVAFQKRGEMIRMVTGLYFVQRPSTAMAWSPANC